MTYVPERDRERERERMRRVRLDPAYREKERAQQRIYSDTDEHRAHERERYANLSGHEYNRLLLRHRRNKALARMAKRHLPKEKEA